MPEMIVEPRYRGFICTAAHPDGCAANVARQIATARAGGPGSGLGRVLVIGSSAGFGLGSAITASFAWGADVLGVCFEKGFDGKRTGTAGWYNSAAAGAAARAAGRRWQTIVGDAFSQACKDEVLAAARAGAGPFDLVVYSLAAPRRTMPDGSSAASCLKPIGAPYTGKTVDLDKMIVGDITIQPANDDDVVNTVKVMGGEDWQTWIETLAEAGLLAPGCRSVAYSYIGPKVTHPIYRAGTIGAAKDHLEATAKILHQRLSVTGGGAWVSVNKALVTQASSAIPVVPLYISLLFQVMKAKGTHEGTIEQIVRLFADHLAPGRLPSVDAAGRIRVDDREMDPEVQAAVDSLWTQVTTENLAEISDFAGFRRDFRQLFGFEIDGIDYDLPVEVDRPL